LHSPPSRTAALFTILVQPGRGSALEPGTVGQAFGQNFFLSGGAGPYSWAVAAGQLPPGLTLQTFAAPTDANNELAGTPTTAGTFTFTMRLTDFSGQQATQSLSITIDRQPPGTPGRDLESGSRPGPDAGGDCDHTPIPLQPSNE
jgi:hypothetical protein